MEMLARPGAGRSHSFCGHWLHIDEVSKRGEKQPDQPKLWFISGNTGIRHATTGFHCKKHRFFTQHQTIANEPSIEMVACTVSCNYVQV